MYIENLKQIILEQAQITNNFVAIKRRYSFKTANITFITGVYGSNKNNLLLKIKEEHFNNDFYLNFDDERLTNFSFNDFKLLHEAFIELYGVQNTFYFNKIQQIHLWEVFVKQLAEDNFNVYITATNTKEFLKNIKLFSENDFSLTQLYPLSFSEYLDFKKVSFNKNSFNTIEEKVNLKSFFNHYLIEGGFLKQKETIPSELLTKRYQHILYKDIIVLNKVTHVSRIRALGFYLANHIGELISYNGLKHIIKVKHAQTVKNYMQLFEENHLVFLISKFTNFIETKQKNPKKIYYIDHSLANSINTRFLEKNVQYLENIVFLELKRQKKALFYHKEKHYCDFIVCKQNKVIQAVQVVLTLNNGNIKRNKLNGLFEALKLYNLESGLILSLDEEDTILINNKKIEVIPIYKWLLLQNET